MRTINKDLAAVEARRSAEKKNLQGAETTAFARMIRDVKTVPNAMLIGHEIRSRNSVESFGAAVHVSLPASVRNIQISRQAYPCLQIATCSPCGLTPQRQIGREARLLPTNEGRASID